MPGTGYPYRGIDTHRTQFHKGQRSQQRTQRQCQESSKNDRAYIASDNATSASAIFLHSHAMYNPQSTRAGRGAMGAALLPRI